MFNTANSKLQNSLNTNRTPSTSSARPASDVDRNGQEVKETYENERLDTELTDEDPLKYSAKEALTGSGTKTFPEVELPEGYEWCDDWEIDTSYTSVDKEGNLSSTDQSSS